MIAELLNKKFIHTFAVIFLVFFIIGFQSCASATSASNEWGQDSPRQAADADRLLRQAETGDIYEGFAPPKTSTIGILKPQGSYLSPAEQWIPDMIKSAMNNNFRKFASGRITVMNITDEQALEAEVNRSLSGSNDELSLTSRLAARSIMTGKVTKIQGANRFNMEFTITDTETHAILATYSQNHSDIELSEGVAVNKAVESLLKDLNVRLNEAGRYALYGASNEADTALAKGLSAAASGQGLQAMNYLYNATAYNYTASQASTTLARVQNQNEKELQGAGYIVMDFFERQELWQSRLDEFNDFYLSHAPFELFYTPPTPTDMKGSGDSRTYNLSFKIGLRWNQTHISAMEKVLQEFILSGLYSNSREDIRRWELKGLPDDSNLFKGPNNFVYDLIVNVENERGEVITSGPLSLNGSLYRYQNKIYASCTQVVNASFPNIHYDREQITPQIYIRIVRINEVDIKTVGENGFTRVTQTQDGELPAVQRNSLPNGLTSMLEKELAAVREQERALAKEAERQRISREKEVKKETRKREHARQRTSIHLGFAGGSMLGADAGLTYGFSAGIGASAIDAEFGLVFFPGFSEEILGEKKSAMGINLGLNYAFWGRRWHANIGPGVTILAISDKAEDEETTYRYAIPFAQGHIDWCLVSNIYIRLGYHLDFYPEKLSPLFPGNSYKRTGDFFMVHNLLFGAVFRL
jgi:hypothetical protein